MPIRKNSLTLLISAALAFSAACAFGQSTASSSSPVKTEKTAAASASADCSGPVLHRSAADGGDICAPAPAENGPRPTLSTSAGHVQATGANADEPANFDPNVDPFKQLKPLPDGMMPGVKKGSIQDINAVGSRCIGCRGIGNWYSQQAEIRMGSQYAHEIDRSSTFITDPVVTEYVNRIGQNIVRNSDCKVPFTIKVVDSDVINAFALPGGFFYVDSGLILAADSEAELAGVMAHETAHVCAHHAVREMTRANYANIGMVPLIMMTGYTWTGYGIYEATQMMIPIAFLQFSREFEAQADYLGIQYMYKAGYDPDALVRFFEKIENLQKQKPSAVAKIFDTHPLTPDRILACEKEIATILPPRAEYLETTSEFNKVKARLARIENKRRLLQHNTNRPSLRRVSDTKNGQDQPTLHRRTSDSNTN